MTPDELLVRKPVYDESFWESELQRYKTQRVFITGICGSIGSALARKAQEYGADVSGIDQDESAVARAGGNVELGDFSEYVPRRPFDVVFHAAAYKHAVCSERQPRAYMANNVTKTQTLLHHLQGMCSAFVLVSTDKAASCASTMGLTKRAAERMVEREWALRLGNVAYSKGSVLDLWRSEPTCRCVGWGVTRYWMQEDDAALALLLTPLQKPGLYVTLGLPKFTMLEIREAFERLHGHEGKQWEDIPLSPGEVEQETFVSPRESVHEVNGVLGLVRPI